MNWERLREKILDRYYPDEEELRDARELYTKLSDHINQKYGLETHFAGSTGRQTCMTGDKDIDLFILFPEDTDRGDLEGKGLKIGREVFREFDGDFEVSYAEHPYTKGEIEGHEVEIVPCIDTSPENIRSSVDRTPHHSRWVEKRLDEEQRKDVVILKRFLKAQDLYGSSLRVQGFSGYLCEVLVAHFGSFRELMSEAEEWRENQMVDPEKHHEELPDQLERKFSDELLRVVDPVDPERNVASVMSDQNYAQFIYSAWRFNSSPGIKFFEREEEEVSKFEIQQEVKSRADFLVMQFERPEQVEDVIYPQMRKALGRIRDELEKRDFQIFESGFHVGNSVRMFFELNSSLPEIKLRKGPKPFHGSKHIGEFTSKYDKTFVRGRSLYAKIEREYPEAREFLSDFLSNDSEQLQAEGIPDAVADKMETARIVEPVQDDKKWLKYLAETLHVK